MRPALPESFLARPIAHRALHDRRAGRIENSPSAIRAAVEAGYGIEIDVQLTADGRAVVFHDAALDRLTDEAGPVRDRIAAELESIRLSGSDDVIPTLEEVLAVVGGRVPLLVEIKDQDGALGAEVGALEAAVAADVEGYAGDLAVMSFNPHSMAEMARRAPGVPRGLTTEEYSPAEWPLSEGTLDLLRGIPDYDKVGASFISHHWRDLARPRVAELKAAGARILCWTIRSAEEEAEARKIAENVTFEGYSP